MGFRHLLQTRQSVSSIHWEWNSTKANFIANGISSIGIDIDPLAVFVSQVKSTPLNPIKSNNDFFLLQESLTVFSKLHQTQEQTPEEILPSNLLKKKKQN